MALFSFFIIIIDNAKNTKGLAFVRSYDIIKCEKNPYIERKI